MSSSDDEKLTDPVTAFNLAANSGTTLKIDYRFANKTPQIKAALAGKPQFISEPP